ncbi:unnamed protein product [Penicillium salamii]|uniref:Uncharacterized protein n=1 Tax=Penicillium salamii TaxID=1612424 RepID=A0A9W4MXN7_9EURO|nr:unnamed protein product [Penicillium salamii]
MEGTIFTDGEMRIARERRIKYQGGARVKIKQISWNPPLPQGLNPDNLVRLRGIFRKDGVHRQDLKNFVPVMTSRSALERAMSRANVSQQNLLASPDQIPLLEFEDMDVHALHGRHRLQVGSEVLAPIERWWTVDIYLDGMHHLTDPLNTPEVPDMGADLKCSLIEEYSNENVPSDGEIYWKIRQYESENDERSRKRWFVRLSKNKQMRLDQLDNKRNRELRQGFNQLLQIRGLWLNGLRISMLHRVIATTAIEEILHYLGYIYDTFLFFVNGDKNSLKRIESDTINSIQLMAPAGSSKDSLALRGMTLSGQAFGLFDEQERKAIWSRLETFQGIIPSLYTFFEDFKYLEACSHCVKQIISAPVVSIKNTMKHSYGPNLTIENSFPIQESETSFFYRQLSPDECFDIAYRQIWLFAMRNYLLMPRVTESEERLLAKPGLIKPDAQVLYNMAKLADCLGFQSSEIHDVLINSPDRQIALSALLQARKPGQYAYQQSQLDSLVTRVVECFSAADEIPHTPSIILADSLVEARARCGIPRFKTHSQDKAFLFPASIHRVGPFSESVSTFFVRQCVYFAFFGKPDYSISATSQSPPSAPSGTTGVDAGSDSRESRVQPVFGSVMQDTEMDDEGVSRQEILDHPNLESVGGTQEVTTSSSPGSHESNQPVMNSSLHGEVSPSSEALIVRPMEDPTFQISSVYREPEQSTEMGGDDDESCVPIRDAQYPVIHTPYSPSIYSSRVSELSEPSTVIHTSELLFVDVDLEQRRRRVRDDSRLQRLKDPVSRPRSLKTRSFDVSFYCFHLDDESWSETARLENITRSNSSEIEKKATHYMSKGFILHDEDGNTLNPGQCFKAADTSHRHRILLISHKDSMALENLGAREKYRKVEETLKASDETLTSKRPRDKSEETL